VEALVVVHRRVHARRDRQVKLDVGQQRRRREAESFDGEAVDERFQRRAGLAARAHAVVLSAVRDVVEVGRADVREELAGRVVDHDDRRRRHVTIGERPHDGARCLLGFALEIARDRRAHFAAALLGGDRCDEVRRAEAPLPRAHRQWLALRSFRFVRTDPSGGTHAVENAIAPSHDSLRVLRHRVDRRSARKRRERRGFREREIARRLVEVHPARPFDAAEPRPERRTIQVLLEDPLLRERRFDPKRERHLAELAEEIAAMRTHEARELHRERRRARHDSAIPERRRCRARDRQRIDARVRVKPPVLGREQRFDRVLADVVERNPPRARRVVRAHLAQQAAVAIEVARRLRSRRAFAKLRRQRRQRRRHDERENRREREPEEDPRHAPRAR
jgi:hypothetical protein